MALDFTKEDLIELSKKAGGIINQLTVYSGQAKGEYEVETLLNNALSSICDAQANIDEAIKMMPEGEIEEMDQND